MKPDATAPLGTDPQWQSFRPRSDFADAGPDVIRDAVAQMRDDGATWFRATDVNDGPTHDGVWIEGWKERPEQEAPFNPPLYLLAPSA